VTLTGATRAPGPGWASEERWWSGEGSVADHSAIAAVQGVWSGRSTLVAQGWSIGTTASSYRMCRYSADQDGSGAVDQNAEHPDSYDHVDHALMEQNFLIVKGNETCPLSPSSVMTAQHQP